MCCRIARVETARHVEWDGRGIGRRRGWWPSRAHHVAALAAPRAARSTPLRQPQVARAGPPSLVPWPHLASPASYPARLASWEHALCFPRDNVTLDSTLRAALSHRLLFSKTSAVKCNPDSTLPFSCDPVHSWKYSFSVYELHECIILSILTVWISPVSH